MKNVAILFAGGIGKRMNISDIPKQFLEVDGKPILVYTIEIFQKHVDIDGIIVVCVSNWIERTNKLIHQYGLTKVKKVIAGGATGHESRLIGLRCAKKYYNNAVVLIHDGVRPLINADTISQSINCTLKYGSAVVCSPAIETIYHEDGNVSTIIPREQCSLMRAPQCFYLTEILSLYEKASSEGYNDIIDSVTLMQMFGKNVPKVIGPAENIKITTPLDFYMFEGIMKNRKKKEKREQQKMILNEDIKWITEDHNINWNKLNNAKVLVTGATGLIGSLCIRTLLSLDIPVQVYALVRDRSRAECIFGDKVNYVIGDVRNPIDSDFIADFIIHCASNTKSKMMIEEPIDTIDISINGTMNILRYAKKSKTKSIVYISSMEAYGITERYQNPVTEEKLGYIDLSLARSSYSEGKRASECLCSAFYHQCKLPVKIVRLALTMGAGISISDNRVSMQFAKSVINGTDIVLHTEGKTLSNFCYTSDSIRGIFTVLLNGIDGETYNVCNDIETRSIRKIAELVAEKVAGGAIQVVYDIPKSNSFGYAPDVTLRLSSKKLMSLGWTPKIDLECAYNRLIQYIKGE